jgi:type 1 glutamine amidotransferase
MARFGEMLEAATTVTRGSVSAQSSTRMRRFPHQHFGAPFAFTDEFYQARNITREVRVLLRLDVSKMPPNDEVLRSQTSRSWAKNYGKGRVFYSALGHAASTWDNRDVGQMYLEAIKWAMGLTEGDATPRPMPATK